MKKDLKASYLYPMPCPRCHQLTFFYQTTPENFALLDHLEAPQQEHHCSCVGGYDFFVRDIFPLLSSIKISLQELFVPPHFCKSAAPLKKYYSGIIIKIEALEQQNLMIDVMTTSGAVLKIKTCCVKGQDISVGMLIDLKGLVFLKDRTARLSPITSLFIEPKFSPKPLISKHYNIILSADEHEQLELYLNKFIQTAQKMHINFLSILPQPIKKIDDVNFYYRQITFPVQQSFTTILEKLPLPEKINLTIQMGD